MNLKDYVKDYHTSNSQYNKEACIDMLRRAKRNLIHRIAQNANGSKEELAKVFPIVDEFFGEK